MANPQKWHPDVKKRKGAPLQLCDMHLDLVRMRCVWGLAPHFRSGIRCTT